jgi:UDPglucose--hexose-1-phosphate uridylyltransferase
MPESIVFRKEIKQTRQHDPRNHFALSTPMSEVRYDPLTGESGRICHFAFDTAPPADLNDLIASSATNCPFCPESVLKITARFPQDIVSEGRLQRDDAVLFPNLFPYDRISAVAVISENHFYPLDDMPTRVIENGIGIARDFLARLENDPNEQTTACYGIVTWNYMPPAGATQVHPHMQVLYTTTPGNALQRQLTAERTYQKRYGSTYRANLIAKESSEGIRWIGESGAVLWYTPFVPSGILGDAVAVFPRRATLTQISDQEISDFAEGLCRVLRGFASIGVWSFNLMFYPDCMGSHPDHHWLMARIVARLYMNPHTHVTDVAHLQLMMEERLAMVYPEDTAARLRKYF